MFFFMTPGSAARCYLRTNGYSKVAFGWGLDATWNGSRRWALEQAGIATWEPWSHTTRWVTAQREASNWARPGSKRDVEFSKREREVSGSRKLGWILVRECSRCFVH